MRADMNTFGIVQVSVLIFCNIVGLGTGACFENFLQRCFPCFQSLCHGNLHVFIFNGRLVCHFTDQSVSDSQLAHFLCFYFADNIAETCAEQVSLVHIVLNLHTHLVTKCHFAHSRSDTLTVNGISCHNTSGLNVLMEFCVLIFQCLKIRKVILCFRRTQPHQLMSRGFQFRCDDISLFCHIHRKGYQCRRNINIIKCS